MIIVAQRQLLGRRQSLHDSDHQLLIDVDVIQLCVEPVEPHQRVEAPELLAAFVVRPRRRSCGERAGLGQRTEAVGEVHTVGEPIIDTAQVAGELGDVQLAVEWAPMLGFRKSGPTSHRRAIHC